MHRVASPACTYPWIGAENPEASAEAAVNALQRGAHHMRPHRTTPPHTVCVDAQRAHAIRRTGFDFLVGWSAILGLLPASFVPLLCISLRGCFVRGIVLCPPNTQDRLGPASRQRRRTDEARRPPRHARQAKGDRQSRHTQGRADRRPVSTPDAHAGRAQLVRHAETEFGVHFEGQKRMGSPALPQPWIHSCVP